MNKTNTTASAVSKVQNHSILPYLAFFFAANVCGWMWEVIVFWVQHSAEYSLWELALSYRGVLHGPWAPIYGVGAVLMVLLHRKVGRRPACYFLTCMGICAVVEYVTSWCLEQIFHAKWWDYTGYFLNINGRICAMSLLFFALAGMVVVYGLAPLFWRGVEHIPNRGLAWGCAGITFLFLLDLFLSLAAPNLGLGVQILS